MHLVGFLHGVIPVMSAATISRAVSQFLVACIGNGDISDQIVAYFIYSLFVAHTLGYLVALYMKGVKNFEYYFGLATDNASFSWNSTLTLAIINWLYTEKSLGIALAAWFCLIVLVFLVIYLSNFVQDKVIRPSKDTKFVLRNFESESFALAISYSFTVIIAASIYKNNSTNYLSNTDDINSTMDDSKTSGLDWLFFGYVLIITAILVYIQQRADKKQDKRLSQFRDSSVDWHGPPPVSSFTPPPLTGVDVTSTTTNALLTSNAISESGGAAVSSPPGPLTASLRSGKGPRNDTLKERVIVLLFPWDEDRSTVACYKCLFNTSAGYLVGCGWNVWAEITFRTYFTFQHGDIVSAFVFALSMTVAIVVMMTRISVREELKVRATIGDLEHASTAEEDEEDEQESIRNGTAGRGDLLFIFGT